MVWTRGEPADSETCVLLTAALAGGDADLIEFGRWGPYNVILRVGRTTENTRYFLAEVREQSPEDAA
jgi:hypothetical protein